LGFVGKCGHWAANTGHAYSLKYFVMHYAKIFAKEPYTGIV
jgi:hypothetical protein